MSIAPKNNKGSQETENNEVHGELLPVSRETTTFGENESRKKEVTVNLNTVKSRTATEHGQMDGQPATLTNSSPPLLLVFDKNIDSMHTYSGQSRRTSVSKCESIVGSDCIRSDDVSTAASTLITIGGVIVSSSTIHNERKDSQRTIVEPSSNIDKYTGRVHKTIETEDEKESKRVSVASKNRNYTETVEHNETTNASSGKRKRYDSDSVNSCTDDCVQKLEATAAAQFTDNPFFNATESPTRYSVLEQAISNRTWVNSSKKMNCWRFVKYLSSDDNTNKAPQSLHGSNCALYCIICHPHSHSALQSIPCKDKQSRKGIFLNDSKSSASAVKKHFSSLHQAELSELNVKLETMKRANRTHAYSSINQLQSHDMITGLEQPIVGQITRSSLALLTDNNTSDVVRQLDFHKSNNKGSLEATAVVSSSARDEFNSENEMTSFAIDSQEDLNSLRTRLQHFLHLNKYNVRVHLSPCDSE